MSHPPDNFVLCESCSQQHDDSCAHYDPVSGFWFCDFCWDKMGRVAVDPMTKDEENCRGYSAKVFKSWK